MTTTTRKSILITGCSEHGIGHSLALAFHGLGLRVIATARRLESMQKLSAAGIETFPLDVNDVNSISELHSTLQQYLSGRIDYLLNNAGVDYAAPAIEADMAKIRQLFETNVLSLMQMCQTFSDMVIAARGCIVNHSSVLGTSLVVPFGSHYNASKAAVLSYSNALRVELAPFHVNVITLISGEVRSNISRTDPSLPETSLYASIVHKFASRASTDSDSAARRMPAEDYARSVAAKILRDSPGTEIWEGSSSWIVWFLTTFVPRSIHTRITSSGFELWRVEKDHELRAKNS